MAILIRKVMFQKKKLKKKRNKKATRWTKQQFILNPEFPKYNAVLMITWTERSRDLEALSEFSLGEYHIYLQEAWSQNSTGNF